MRKIYLFKKVLLFFYLLFFCVALLKAQTILYVNASAVNNGTGTTWTNAYNNLESALVTAKSNAGNQYEIRVAAGTYKPTNTPSSGDGRDATFLIERSGVKIIGGYNASTGTRNIAANPTILSGDRGTLNNNSDNNYFVMVMDNLGGADSVVVDGVTITGGNGNGSGILYVPSGLAIYRSYAGGMVIKAARNNVAIRNVVFSGNSGGSGGMFITDSQPFVTNCVFSGNAATTLGGGIQNDFSSSVIANCIFTGNTASLQGGAVYNNSSSPTIINSTFSSNSAIQAGSVMSNYSSSSNPALKNCIIWGNAGSIFSNENNSSTTVTYSTVQGGYAGTGNISTDPFFANAADPDGADNIWSTADDGLKLQSCSPAVNAGTNTGVPLTDILGLPRIQYSTVDMGAYETNSIPAATAPLQTSNATATAYQLPNGTTQYGSTCTALIASVTGNNTSTSISGNTTAKVWIETIQPMLYVKRHYEITPAANATTATGRITLYFTQQEFTDFNAVNATKLPVDAADAANNKANLVIEKYGGTSSNGTGLPASYSGTIEVIDPANNDIVWNAAATRWEVSFNTTGFSGFFAKTPATILPLHLLSFVGKYANNTNNLIWKTADESGILHYELQRSINARDFTEIATITAHNGPSQTYTYDDAYSFTENVYYRLKIVNQDGKVEYSTVVKLTEKSAISISILPNPVQSFATIKMDDIALLHTEIIIVDSKGSMLLKQQINSMNQQLSLGQFIPGMYFIKFANGETRKLMKN